MRWLIAGPYPPSPADAAARTLSHAVARLQAGDHVEVVSPVPSAAHRYHDLRGVRGIAYLLRAAVGRNAIYLCIEPLIGRAPHASRRRLVELTLLAALLHSVPRSILDISNVDMLPGGRAGRRVLQAADEFVVDGDEGRDRLLAAGVEPDKVRVVAVTRRRTWADDLDRVSRGADFLNRPVPGADIPDDADRAVIQRWVRTRASELSDAARIGQDSAQAAIAVRALPLLVLPTPSNDAKGHLGRVIARFTSWQLRPIVEHVNRLQHAVLRDLTMGQSGPRGVGPADRPGGNMESAPGGPDASAGEPPP